MLPLLCFEIYLSAVIYSIFHLRSLQQITSILKWSKIFFSFKKVYTRKALFFYCKILTVFYRILQVEKLVGKMVKWLKPGGHIFFRESCFHQSGDSKRKVNPTHYREPRFYTKVILQALPFQSVSNFKTQEWNAVYSTPSYVTCPNSSTETSSGVTSLVLYKKLYSRTNQSHLFNLSRAHFVIQCRGLRVYLSYICSVGHY